ncbi:alpha-ketoglutarate-dependent dioxygenase AlkB [Planobispora takensis]|uniref:Alkylated DNA repair protein n=1 Tax=Planobispora takensis TaxID=1367882 RepID=A0A8J3T3R3_9ACTN|nr:alkylated DNA repair protein [Planobispora takensis]
MPGWLSLPRQRELVQACRRWAAGPVPMRRVRMPGGRFMSVRTVCLGWHWQPYRYSRTADDAGGRPMTPVVSLSLGDSCLFRFGTPLSRGRPYTDLELASGDLFVFGGPSRLAYHGVPKVYPGTADPALGMGGGRLNITLRVSGLS